MRSVSASQGVSFDRVVARSTHQPLSKLIWIQKHLFHFNPWLKVFTFFYKIKIFLQSLLQDKSKLWRCLDARDNRVVPSASTFYDVAPWQLPKCIHQPPNHEASQSWMKRVTLKHQADLIRINYDDSDDKTCHWRISSPNRHLTRRPASRVHHRLPSRPRLQRQQVSQTIT